jgi:glycine cleavage system H protein
MSNSHQNLKFTATHEWISTDEDNMKIGITEHAQQLLGDMVFVELPRVGDEVNAGEELGVLESVKAASDFYAPIGGTIIEINTMVNENPALLNTDPYGQGWLVKIQAHDCAEIDDLLDEEQYHNEIAEEH